jgi:small conductance mechanosensitive channel
MVNGLFAGSDPRAALGMALVAVGALAYLLSEVAARLVRRLLVLITGDDGGKDLRSPIVQRPIRVTRATVFVAALVMLFPPALQLAGVAMPVGLAPDVLTGWLLGSGLRIVVITLLTYLLVRIVASAARRLEAELSHGPSAVEAAERARSAKTLGRLAQNLLTALLTAVATLMVLRELGVDILPILTGAGILGLAVGFGAQTLVKDLIAGFFLILEDHVRVGDVATINGTGGLVEAINLRTIVLRDLEGVVHVFPNGSVETLANRTKDFSYCVLSVGVAYKEDTDVVTGVLHEVGAEFAVDPLYQDALLEPLEVLGVDAFDDSQVTIKIRIKTVPLEQWAVGRELRRRIKMAFDTKGIEIPYPHMSVYFGEASKPIVVRQAD